MVNCTICYDTKKMMGNGMMIVECKHCPKPQEAVVTVDIDKSSREYKRAIKDIMKLNDTLTKEDAMRIFEEEYQK